MRVKKMLLPVSLLLMMSACSTYRVAPADAPAPIGRIIRVQFSAPTDLMLQTATGDPLPAPGVTELRGALVARSPDTISMSVSGATQVDSFGSDDSITRRFGQLSFGNSIRFELPENAELLVRHFDAGKTVLGAVASVGVFYLIALVIFAADPDPFVP